MDHVNGIVLFLTAGCCNLSSIHIVRNTNGKNASLLLPLLSRHRVVNLFLQGYNKSWISAEDHSFEEKLVGDLAKTEKVSLIDFCILK